MTSRSKYPPKSKKCHFLWIVSLFESKSQAFSSQRLVNVAAEDGSPDVTKQSIIVYRMKMCISFLVCSKNDEGRSVWCKDNQKRMNFILKPQSGRMCYYYYTEANRTFVCLSADVTDWFSTCNAPPVWTGLQMSFQHYKARLCVFMFFFLGYVVVGEASGELKETNQTLHLTFSAVKHEAATDTFSFNGSLSFSRLRLVGQETCR